MTRTRSSRTPRRGARLTGRGLALDLALILLVGLSLRALLVANGLLGRGSHFAAINPVVDGEGFGIPDRALQAGPWAHEGADLLAREARQAIGGAGKDGDPAKRIGRDVAAREAAQQLRRIGEVEDQRAAGRKRDQ